MQDQEMFAVLKCLINEQKFAMGVNPSIANSPGSPGYRAYENSLALWGTIAAVIYVFFGYGWLIGLLSIPVGIVVFLLAGRVVHNRACSRTRRWALSSASRFLAMWELGAISLKDSMSGQTAISARGDDLSQFVCRAVNEVLGAEDDPVARKLEATLERFASASSGET